jgi:2-polyprenyl-3-methyl-5-hydroxy-6-metoxy-1,4-benzoquinol methylase
VNRSAELEMMDLPGQPRELLADDLRNLRVFNRYLGGHRNVLRGVARLVRAERLQSFSLLDVGTGCGDVPSAIVRWAKSHGVSARIVALEREAVSVDEAAEQTRGSSAISLLRGDAMAPPFGAACFDFVLASQFLHHFPDDQIITLLRGWARLARRAIIVNDLVRHPLAYHGIRWLTKTFTRNPMTRTDGPLSVARACTIAEWRELFRRAGVGKVSIEWALPFRVLGILSIQKIEHEHL